MQEFLLFTWHLFRWSRNFLLYMEPEDSRAHNFLQSTSSHARSLPFILILSSHTHVHLTKIFPTKVWAFIIPHRSNYMTILVNEHVSKICLLQRVTFKSTHVQHRHTSYDAYGPILKNYCGFWKVFRLVSYNVHTFLGPTEPSHGWVPRFFSDRRLKLITHLLLVLRLRMHGAKS